jgi:GNAT superfamily N-acetyltransferase
MDDPLALPDRFTTRSLTFDDLDAVFQLIAACEEATNGTSDIDPEDVRSDWSRPGFDLETDAIAVCDGDRVAATAEVFKNRADVNVHPNFERLGIGAWLLPWTEERSRALGRPKVGQTLADSEVGAMALLQRNGYSYGHTSWMLAIELESRPAEPDLPDRISVRTFVPGQDDRATYRVVEDAFNEWPSREPATFDEWAALTIRRQDFEPDLLQLAMAGERVVGVVYSIDYPGDDGWIQQVAVAATHRRRGIARALLLRAFAMSWDRGDRVCGLSTDSRTGALGLYEKVGMHVTRSYTNLTKELQLGG